MSACRCCWRGSASCCAPSGVERPSIDRLVRLVGWARERAHEQTFERLALQLTDPLRAKLDGLLVTDGGHCRHAWLRSRPTSVSARALRRELDKRAFLVGALGADRFDLSSLPPNRRAWLAQTGRQQTNQALSRMAGERRYPVLMCFCVEALERTTDDAIEIYDRALGGADRAAQRKREEFERRGRRDTQTTVRRFIDLSQVVLEAHDSGADILRLIERRIGIERLREDLDRARGVARPNQTGHLDLLIADSGAGRKLFASVISSLELRPAGVDEDELLAALRLIRQLAGDTRRWLPGFSPSAFIDAPWRPHVVDAARGRLDRRAYELCAAYELRTALRAGRVWVRGSRRHADPSSLLLPDGDWHQIRSEFARAVEQPVTHARDRCLLDHALEVQAALVEHTGARVAVDVPATALAASDLGAGWLGTATRSLSSAGANHLAPPGGQSSEGLGTPLGTLGDC